MRAKAGYGGVEVEIHIQKGEHRGGGLLRGKVHLLGGKSTKKVRCLHLRLFREWSTERYEMDLDVAVAPGWSGVPVPFVDSVEAQYDLEGEKGKDELLHIELARDIQIHAGERRIFPFEIKLPQKRMEEGVSEAWKLQAQADIPLARDAFVERKIKPK